MTISESEIQSRIDIAAQGFVEQVIKTDSGLAAAIKAKDKTYLAINSSFLYREKQLVKTLQSPKRLVALIIGSGKKPCIDQLMVTGDIALTKHYRILDSLDSSSVTGFPKAVSNEIDSIGDVIMVLIGIVKGFRSAAEPVSSGLVKTLRLDPLLANEFDLTDQVCAIKRVMTIEDLFAEISKALGGDTALTDNDRQAVAKAYDHLLDDATTEVAISAKKKVNSKETILGKITESLQIQVDEYQAALKEVQKSGTDPQALNEVLRIAYNFSTDVLPLVFLFMSICDLKPLIFWCTVDKQWALYRAFASLPWAALGRKEKLHDYRDVIAAARNHAFHHVLPFDTTVEVDLSTVDVRAERMRLFLPHGQKNQHAIQLNDQELIDVFAEFSRAKQRPVSTVFWQRNLQVMKATTDLAAAVLDTLLLIHQSRPKKVS
ncbi:hypothetical protein ANRL4_05363 [Anaerolineae bacterium]|nr:hypothetical protein ANRL4_05363 [Anaerolineae bacterium]